MLMVRGKGGLIGKGDWGMGNCVDKTKRAMVPQAWKLIVLQGQ